MDLSIIIVNYKSSHVLGECLESVFLSETPARFEVIVVDNHSFDEGLPPLKARYPQVRFIASNENRGFAGGCNIGIRASAGDAILLLNPDAKVAKKAIETLLRKLAGNPAVGIAGPKVLYPDGTLQTRHMPKKMPSLWGFFCEMFYLDKLFTGSPVMNGYYGAGFRYEDEQAVDQVSGAALMIRKEAVEKIGLLDENFFMYFEEIDWCARARRAGYKVFYVPAAEVVHRLGESAKRDARRRAEYFHASQLYLTRKYYGRPAALCLYAINLFGFIFRLAAVPIYLLKDRRSGKAQAQLWSLAYHLNLLNLRHAVAR